MLFNTIIKRNDNYFLWNGESILLQISFWISVLIICIWINKYIFQEAKEERIIKRNRDGRIFDWEKQVHLCSSAEKGPKCRLPSQHQNPERFLALSITLHLFIVSLTCSTCKLQLPITALDLLLSAIHHFVKKKFKYFFGLFVNRNRFIHFCFF